MSYYVSHTLTIEPDVPEIWNEIKKRINIDRNEIMDEMCLGEFDFDDFLNYQHVFTNRSEEVLFYLFELSKKLPDVLLCVICEGEEAGNIWVEYFRNGRCQQHHAEIIIPSMKEDCWE